MNRPIGVIDSGVGGLTVVSELLRQLPNEEIIYIGDTERCPYGPRTIEEVRIFTWEMIDYLLYQNIKLLVIACNTATAVVLEEAKHKLDVPVIGVIHPGSIAAIKKTKNYHIGVIGTEGTIKSNAYENEIKKINHNIRVESLACPNLVPIVELGLLSGIEANRIVKESIAPILKTSIDCLILGCTHYPLLSPIIGEISGPQVKIISSGQETAREVSSILYHNKLLFTGERLPSHTFYCTAFSSRFEMISKNWLRLKSINVREISIRKSLYKALI